ncbi:winged helix-turn-helix transcriptional regulator [Streptomyces sp. NPDC002133]|uniref:winged helix-turn-helix transcriptional regulator n=1 Tax=Streptomyces sp. NPDC002133 TaxID=3154409 RepID=UPI0033297428
MLRIHFSGPDLGRIRLPAEPDPLWETAASLHRLQTRRGRGTYAAWLRFVCEKLSDPALARTVRHLLLPLFPRAAYFPDFLTPSAASEGLATGLDAIRATPAARVTAELDQLAAVVTKTPRGLSRLAAPEHRNELTAGLRAYHDALIAPYEEAIHTRIEAERVFRTRSLLGKGIEDMLADLGPAPGFRWCSPVLEADHPTVDMDLHLGGRGLRLVPSYFCWGSAVVLADPELPPVLVYPLHHERLAAAADIADGDAVPLTTLLGRTRALVLRASATGATGNELARALGISPGTVTFHTKALRDSRLIASVRYATTVLHTLTPLGSALLTANSTRTRTSGSLRRPRGPAAHVALDRE